MPDRVSGLDDILKHLIGDLIRLSYQFGQGGVVGDQLEFLFGYVNLKVGQGGR